MSAEPIVVKVERGLADLIPLFLGQRKADQASLAQALPQRDFETIRRTGHGMAGAGASYGFDFLSELGHRIEVSARASDAAAIALLKLELDDYLARLVVKYL